jgi:histidyl-tRNA synthetase
MPSTTDVYVANLGADMKIPAFAFAQALRDKNVKADCDLAGRSLKAQFKFADKIGAKYVAIVGGEEYERGVIKLRNMETKEERELPLETAAEEIAQIAF